jgi:hypothetical protein
MAFVPFVEGVVDAVVERIAHEKRIELIEPACVRHKGIDRAR